MKSLKPFVLVLAGMLITAALFSFKNGEPKKEYLTLHSNNVMSPWVITKPDLTEIKIEKGDYYVTQLKAINDLTNEGWQLVATSNGYVESNLLLYFERVKQ